MRTECYAKGTPLVTLFSDKKRVKILAVMLRDHERDLNASDISRMAGIEGSTFYDHIDTLLDYGLVKITREVGNSRMYTINKDSEAAQAIAQFEWTLLDAVNEDGKPDSRVDERE